MRDLRVILKYKCMNLWLVAADESLETLYERLLDYEKIRLLLTLAVTEFYFHYYFVGGVIHSITSITNNDN